MAMAIMGHINPCQLTHPWPQAMKGATPQTAPLSLNQALGSQAQAAQANLPPDRRRADTGRS